MSIKIKAQVTRQFLHRGRVVLEGKIIEDYEHEIRALEKNNLVSRDLRMELVSHIPGREIRSLDINNLPKINIGIPAWGEYYVDLACRYTIPSILYSLNNANFSNINFIIHTDNEAPFRDIIGNNDISINFMKLLPMGPIPSSKGLPRLPDNYWVAFKQAHIDILQATRYGEIAVLWNSDIVCSLETFKYIQDQFIMDKRVIASVGVRSDIDSASPPLGVRSAELFDWIWQHPHHISQECIWNGGRSHHPTILFFDDEQGNRDIHCFHLTPMFIRKDRDLIFKGTIDDDVLGRYLSEEIAYPHNGEIAFAELSPRWKKHPYGENLSVEEVLNFWGRRMMRPHYLRNFSQRLNSIGHSKKNHPKAQEIIDSLYRIWSGTGV